MAHKALAAQSASQWRTILPAVACFGSVMMMTPAPATEPTSVAILGTHFQNDNEMYEPTSPSERARQTNFATLLKQELERSGRFKVMPVPAEMQSKIDAGQTLGEYGGCELDLGAQLGVDEVAWINVQKVSNLILNLNVYMADVKHRKMTFQRSVDIRGNTDESWRRSLIYLVENYLLPSHTAAPAG